MDLSAVPAVAASIPARTLDRGLRPLMIATDVGFIAYWALTLAHLIPPEYAYSDYRDPVVVAWNWSFLPLDLIVSATGLTGLALARRGRPSADRFITTSLTLTVASGLQALAFWAFRCQFDPTWWALNGFLLAYPVPYLVRRHSAA